MMPAALSDDAFSAATLYIDLEAVAGILADFFAQVTPADWNRPTDRSAGGWTLQQTLAHVTSIAERFYEAMDATLTGAEPIDLGFTSYKGLAAFNERETARRRDIPPAALIQTLLDRLRQTATRAATLTPQEMALRVPV